MSERQLCREGVLLLLSDRVDEAEEHFSKYYGPYHPQLSMGYCYVKCVIALTSWEEVLMQEAYKFLKKTFKMLSKMQSAHQDMGTPYEKMSLKLLCADAQLFSAVLIMTRNKSVKRYIKAGVYLRRAWKIYSNCHKEVEELCEIGSTYSDSQDVADSSQTSSIDEQVIRTEDKKREERRDEEEEDLFGDFFVIEDIKSFLQGYSDIPTVEEMMELRAAAQFGFGLFHLVISLVPPKLMKIVHMFGFSGNRAVGIRALQDVARSDDMRSHISSIILLWYHLVVKPFFVHERSAMAISLRQAELVLGKVDEELLSSSIMKFFRGRMCRLQGDYDGALMWFHSAAEKTVKMKEIKLLCYYEIGWCYLILWDWTGAAEQFKMLKDKARWSKVFYTYLSSITYAACDMQEEAQTILGQVHRLTRKTMNAELDSYCSRKSSHFKGSAPSGYQGKLLCLELLYLWRCLDLTEESSLALLQLIDGRTSDLSPDFVACSQLMLGVAYLTLSEHDKAERSLLNVIMMTKDLPQLDHYYVVCALYELALLYHKLMRMTEAKRCSGQCKNDFKGYDFESRLSVRLYALPSFNNTNSNLVS